MCEINLEILVVRFHISTFLHTDIYRYEFAKCYEINY